MWSFIAIFVLVAIGFALLTHPAVGRVLGVLMELSIFFLLAFIVSLGIWLAI